MQRTWSAARSPCQAVQAPCPCSALRHGCVLLHAEGVDRGSITFQTVRPADYPTPYDTMLSNGVQFSALDKRGGRLQGLLVRGGAAPCCSFGAGQGGGAWLQQVEEHRGTCPIRHRRARRLVAGLLARAGRVDVFGRSFRVAGMVLGTRRGGGQREVTGERERASRACVGGGPGVAQPPPQHGTLPAP